MNIERRITAFAALGDFVLKNPVSLQEIVNKTFIYNTWFTIDNINQALQNIAIEFLNKEKLENWISGYGSKITTHDTKTIAIVAAGNIPMVAFHDILCVLISGNKLQLKLSEKDQYLLPFLLEQLINIEPDFKELISIQFKLEKFDAIIATGSNNTAKHFAFYFGKYKNIIRRNRNSVAILTGEETKEDIENLGHDIFDYFGLGCRNVSKIFVPEKYDLYSLKDGLTKHIGVNQHNQYMNNLDYQRTLYLMNQTPLIDIDFINIVENNSLHSPISCLHVERYKTLEDVKKNIAEQTENIQCVVGKGYLEFGKSQQPGLSDYADNVDTMEFILNL
ncbi:MAG TPA: acyl-CoA reductase [Chitinophagales bacterium]|nr:acyl-CoA reductase [Chitinophagales bacterium]